MATKVQPRISILDRRFKYSNSANTDVRRTWRRAQAERRAAAKPHSVVQLKKRSASC